MADYVRAMIAGTVASESNTRAKTVAGRRQAMITGTFSIVRQSMALGCFPRVTVRHTSAGVEGAPQLLGWESHDRLTRNVVFLLMRLRDKCCTRLTHLASTLGPVDMDVIGFDPAR